MSCGVPEYVLLFRKPPSDLSNGYADEMVVKSKPDTEFPDGSIGPYDYDGGKIVPGTGYSRARWQLDAHGYQRCDGNRLLSSEEISTLLTRRYSAVGKSSALERSTISTGT